ncbi:MAG: YhcH/YjgK/YiaL family protein [Bacillota bacterium]|nr:YhcH/YjgK/YiaL family protein [Bacillota bacterium]
MIIDKLSNAASYYGLSSKIEGALRYLQDNDLETLKPDTYYIDGSYMYLSVSEYETKKSSEAFWEAHRKYIDVQYIIQGVEKMGYTNVENIKVTAEYDENRDVLFGEGTGDFVTVQEGSFVIFMPQDAHMPNIAVKETGHVRKAVIKILIK